MSNTSKGKGVKGSKYWIQIVVNSDQRDKLNAAIGDRLIWISPLENEQFAEYQLKQSKIRNSLNIDQKYSKEIFSFWPARQPQWDGIAISEDKSTLYLIEAKSHLNELKSKISARSESSRQLIVKTMEEVISRNYPKGSIDLWLNVYYQLGNRITFLHKMNDINKTTGLKVKLVLLNFTEDPTYKPTTAVQWNNHYKEVFKGMFGFETTPQDVLLVNFPVN